MAKNGKIVIFQLLRSQNGNPNYPKSPHNAQVKLFWAHPPGSPGVREKVCVIKKGGVLENEVRKGSPSHWKVKGLKWLIRAGQDKKKCLEDRDNSPKSDVPEGARGGGGRTVWPAHNVFEDPYWDATCKILDDFVASKFF